LVFLAREGKIKISGFNSEIKKILKLCDGFKGVDFIMEESGISANLFNALIKTLIEYEIIIDSREIYRWFHSQTADNAPYKKDIDIDVIDKIKYFKINHNSKNSDTVDLDSLLENRKSCRSFSGKLVTKKEIVSYLRALYYLRGNPTVPSGGGLYPLRFYVFILNSDVRSGIYEYDAVKSELKFIKSVHRDLIYFAFQDQDIIEKAGFITCVCARIDVHPTKYSNRGYRYTLIEAGHVCQNAYLWSAKNKLGVCSWGAFSDEQVRALIGADKNVYPIIAIVSGKKALRERPYVPTFKRLHLLIDRYFNKLKIIKEFYSEPIRYKKELIPKYCAVSSFNGIIRYKKSLRVSEGKGFGASYSKEESCIKAIVESLERYLSGKVRSDIYSSYDSLGKSAIHPYKLMPVNEGYYGVSSIAKKVRPFVEKNKYEWIRGRYLKSDKSVYVLSDLVFYPLSKKFLGRYPIFRSNSSGVAAHFDRDKALENAILELIERDAFSVLWYSKKKTWRLPEKILSDHVLDKLSFWKKQGREILFFDITVDSVPVIMCIINSDKYPFITVGAKAHFDYRVAIDKSLEEAEYAMLAWIKNKRDKIKAEDVVSPGDHGLYYSYIKNKNDLAWLINARTVKSKKFEILRDTSITVKQLINKFNLIEVIIHEAIDDNDLWVIKAMSESLLPLNFGYGTECSSHNRLSHLGLKWERKYPSTPHFFP